MPTMCPLVPDSVRQESVIHIKLSLGTSLVNGDHLNETTQATMRTAYTAVSSKIATDTQVKLHYFKMTLKEMTFKCTLAYLIL